MINKINIKKECDWTKEPTCIIDYNINCIVNSVDIKYSMPHTKQISNDCREFFKDTQNFYKGDKVYFYYDIEGKFCVKNLELRLIPRFKYFVYFLTEYPKTKLSQKVEKHMLDNFFELIYYHNKETV